MRKEVKFYLFFLIGFSIMTVYQLIESYMRGEMTIFEVIINLAIFGISWLILKDIYKYSDGINKEK